MIGVPFLIKIIIYYNKDFMQMQDIAIEVKKV